MLFFSKKKITFFLYIVFIWCYGFASELQTESVPIVLVSVAPHKFFVEKIGGKTVQVYLMVPSGASSHTYEPTPKQMMRAGKGDIWFRIGEPFENRAMQALTYHRPSLQIVDLRSSLNVISTNSCSCCPGCIDLHFWLSLREAKVQAKTIADALSKTYPEHKDIYQTNLLSFQKELDELDQQIQHLLAPLKKRIVVVSHPAYGYFCRDYQLQQYSIEVEGKDPTPAQVTRLLMTLRPLGIRSIFVQMQYSNKAAQLIADQLGASLVTLDPYSEEYFRTMLEIAHAFASQ